MSSTTNVFIHPFSNAGVFRKRTISPQARQLLKNLEYQDLILNPVGGSHGLQLFGINKSRLFKDLNIGRIRIISSAAREKPQDLASLIAGMARVNTLQGLYDQIVEGIKLDLLGIRELEIVSKLEDFNTNLLKLAKEKGLDSEFNISSMDFVGREYEKEQVLDTWKVTIQDAITNQTSKLEIRITEIKGEEKLVTISVLSPSRERHPIEIKGENKLVTIDAVLPWNSPNLVAKLNQLFGMSWYYKYRPKQVSRINYKKIIYVWGFYRTSHPASLKRKYIQDVANDDRLILTGINLTFKEIKELGGIQERKKFASLLEKQLLHSIRSFAHRPDLQNVLPDFYRDLGIVRDLVARTD